MDTYLLANSVVDTEILKSEKMHGSAGSNCRVGNWQGNNNLKNVTRMVIVVLVWCVGLRS